MLAGSVSVLSKYLGVVSSPLRMTAVALALSILPGCGSSGSDGGGIQGTNTLERSIEGTILDVSGQPLSGATISVLETGDQAISNPNGFYVLNVAVEPAVALTLLVEADETSENIVIDGNTPQNITINIQLKSDGTISASIAAQQDKRAFDEQDPAKFTPETNEEPSSVESNSGSGSSTRRVRKASCGWKFNKETLRRELHCRTPPKQNSGEEEGGALAGGEGAAAAGTPAEGGGEERGEDGGESLVPGFNKDGNEEEPADSEADRSKDRRGSSKDAEAESSGEARLGSSIDAL